MSEGQQKLGRRALPDEVIADIRSSRARGETIKSVAARLRISEATVTTYCREAADLEAHKERARERSRRRGAAAKAARAKNGSRAMQAAALRSSRKLRGPIKTASPATRSVLEKLQASKLTDQQATALCGFARYSIKGWRKGSVAPNIMSLEALAQVLGFKLVLAPISASDV